ncbi:MAG: IclR family transcriptional regulator [Phycisphaerales bacterium]|nr:IclR family transcriptional regulator [Phycisphaerales bacterium]
MPQGNSPSRDSVSAASPSRTRRRASAKPDADRSRTYRTPALEKGLDIIELLARSSTGLSLTRIADGLDRSVGEIYRMLTTLVDRGYVRLERPSDEYVLTLRLFELAHAHAPVRHLSTHALPLMKALASTAHQSCHLTIVESGRGVVIVQVDSPGEMGFAVRVGSQMPLPSTASGRVLLAFQTPEDRARILAEVDPGVPVDLDHLDAIRAEGWEEMESTRLRGIHDVSFPVLDHHGRAVAAMTIPCVQRLDRPGETSVDIARQALRETARQLSEAMGAGLFDPPPDAAS